MVERLLCDPGDTCTGDDSVGRRRKEERFCPKRVTNPGLQGAKRQRAIRVTVERLGADAIRRADSSSSREALGWESSLRVTEVEDPIQAGWQKYAHRFAFLCVVHTHECGLVTMTGVPGGD